MYTKALKEAYIGGHVEVIEWLYEKDDSLDISIYDLENIFKKCCAAGASEAAELLYTRYGSCTGMSASDAFINSCASGNIKLIKKIYNDIIPTTIMEDAFIVACGRGDMQIIVLIIELRPNINIHAQQDKAFRESCAAGKKDVAMMLCDTGSVDIHACDDDAFGRAALNNHTEIVTWLHDKGDIKFGRYLFRDVCLLGHRDMAEFLYRINKKEITMHPKEFVQIIYSGHTDVAAMVYDLGKINIRQSKYDMFSRNVDDDGLFIFACTNDMTDMVTWMLSVCDQYHAIIDSNKVIKWWISDREILKQVNSVTKKITFLAQPKIDSNNTYVVLYNRTVRVS